MYYKPLMFAGNFKWDKIMISKIMRNLWGYKKGVYFLQGADICVQESNCATHDYSIKIKLHNSRITVINGKISILNSSH